MSNFVTDDDGAVAAFTVVSFLAMFLAVGMAMDFMRHEAMRTELQDALDRGVLAAAMADDEATAQRLVAGYLKAANFAPQDAGLQVRPTFGTTQKRVTAEARYPINTFFLKLAGITELDVSAASGAATSRSKIEISLALDISGSMSRENTDIDSVTFADLADYDVQPGKDIKRLDLMKVAAKRFVDLMLQDSARTETTINLIPFAGQVNPGPYVMEKFAPNRVHGYSSCLDVNPSTLFSDGDFSLANAKQTPHFQNYRFEADYGHNAEWGWCPSDRQAIEYMSDDADKLKARIDDFVAHDGTGIPIAMAWALGLVNSSTQGLIADLSDQGMVEPQYANRPRPQNSGSDTLKVIVLMTDGQTTRQPRPNPRDYNEPHEIAYLADNHLRGSETMMSVGQGRTYLEDICDMAKEREVVVFTIGFDIAGGSPQSDLKECATSDSQFFDVNGVELAEAFEAIAVTISKLRLVY